MSVLFIVFIAGNFCYAQNSIFAGKIVDEDNKPIPGAILKVSSKTLSPIEVKSDSDGLYCSKPIATGHYHLAIFVNNECRGLKKLSLDEYSGSKKFFLVRVLGGKVEVSRMDSDPAMAVKLNKLANEDPRFDVFFDQIIRVTKKDTTNKNTTPVKTPGERVPQN